MNEYPKWISLDPGKPNLGKIVFSAEEEQELTEQAEKPVSKKSKPAQDSE